VHTGAERVEKIEGGRDRGRNVIEREVVYGQRRAAECARVQRGGKESEREKERLKFKGMQTMLVASISERQSEKER
jgi:hypothetical protein